MQGSRNEKSTFFNFQVIFIVFNHVNACPGRNTQQMDNLKRAKVPSYLKGKLGRVQTQKQKSLTSTILYIESTLICEFHTFSTLLQ